MWIFFNDAMLSIVEHKETTSLLHVRARVRGDIERVFPDAEVIETPGGDYQFRASIPRNRVASFIEDRVKAIGYTNFKNSVPDKERHDVYFKVWNAMWEWQYKLKQRAKAARNKKAR